ncbi:MAG: hypothetical protein SNI32_07360 [Rikenellaceae bacterium]
MRTIILIILGILLVACASLKSIHHSESQQKVVVDNSIVEVVRTEVERQIGSLNQTVVEFYPPPIGYRVTPKPREHSEKEREEQEDDDEDEDAEPIAKPERPPTLQPQQPIKSITTTQITTNTARATLSDSTKLNNIVEHTGTNTEEQVGEQPSNFVLSIKWLAILLGILLIIILIIKIRW